MTREALVLNLSSTRRIKSLTKLGELAHHAEASIGICRIRMKLHLET